MKLYYGEKRKNDIANGPGVRTSLFISGCRHRCKECFNEEAQDFCYGEEFTKGIQDEFVEWSKNPLIKGINLLGGDPMDHANNEEFVNFLVRLKTETNKPIWLWTGYTYDEVMRDHKKRFLLYYVDVLIDGQFVKEKYDINLMYRGSTNQKVIDVKKTILSGKVVELM